MTLPTVLAELPAGLYMLTAQGELGVYDGQQQLQVDAALSRAFAGHLRNFLQAYANAKQAEEYRVAILFNAQQARPWGRLTFSLEEATVRSLYPSSGHVATELTAFQQKSREMSAYRGMELLLEYRRDSAPQLPVYCPVMFDPHATLAARVSATGRAPGEQERDAPVIDVLNLAATIPVAQRGAPALVALMDKLRQGLIRKDQRRDTSWSLGGGDPTRASSLLDAVPAAVSSPAALPIADVQRLHETERVETIERWLKHPPQSVDAQRLRFFTQFRSLDERRLVELSANSFIYTAPAGTRLFDHGLRDAWNLYLIEGALRLIPADGAALRVEGGTDKTSNPIASLKPRKYQVETLSPVSFLWIHDRVLATLSAGATRPFA